MEGGKQARDKRGAAALGPALVAAAHTYSGELERPRPLSTLGKPARLSCAPHAPLCHLLSATMPSQRLPTSHSALQVQLPSGAAPLAASPSAAAASTCSAAAAAADGAASDGTLLSSRILRNQAAARRVLRAQETLIEGVHSLPRFRSLVRMCVQQQQQQQRLFAAAPPLRPPRLR